MSLASLKIIKELCKKYRIYPARTKGQNFLISQNVVDKIIRAGNLTKSDLVLEIGPGLGTITQELAKRVKKVLAVEIDKKLVRILDEILADYKNVEIVHGDILKLNQYFEVGTPRASRPPKVKIRPRYKLIANIPFNITGLVLKKILSEEPKPNLIVLVLQKEVAERIVAGPPKMSLLAVSVQFYGKPEIIARIPRSKFWPQPKVDSAILKIKTTSQKPEFEKDFFKIVKLGFSRPRKKLVNNLKIAEAWLPAEAELRTPSASRPPKVKLLQIFQKLGLKPGVRAQELSVEDWLNLVKLVIHRS